MIKKILFWDLLHEYKSGKRKKTQKKTCRGCAILRPYYTVAYMDKPKMYIGNSEVLHYSKNEDILRCLFGIRIDEEKLIPLEPCFKPKNKREAAACASITDNY